MDRAETGDQATSAFGDVANLANVFGGIGKQQFQVLMTYTNISKPIAELPSHAPMNAASGRHFVPGNETAMLLTRYFR